MTAAAPKPFFAADRFPPRTSRPSGIAWADGHLPKQVEAFVLCHLLEQADGRAAPATLATRGQRKKTKRDRRVAMDAEVAGATGGPGAPPLAAMLAAQSMRFACGPCTVMLHGNPTKFASSTLHSIHAECLHCTVTRMCPDVTSTASLLVAIAQEVVSPGELQPFVRAYFSPLSLVGALMVLVVRPRAVDVVEMLLQHAKAHDWDVVGGWSMLVNNLPNLTVSDVFELGPSPLHAAINAGSVPHMRAILRCGAYDPTLAWRVLANYAKEHGTLTPAMCELVAPYFM